MPRIASYNVHQCIGVDRQLDPERVAEVIREIEVDIIALQEVDARQHPDFYLDQWEFLAEATGHFCIPGISLRTHRNIYGNALLSRWPVRDVRLHDISVTRREPRGAIDADIEVDGRFLRVVATHFGLRVAERRSQVELILDFLSRHGPMKSEKPIAGTVLLGDFNEWRLNANSIRKLTTQFRPVRSPATFPAQYPVFPLDRIFIGGDVGAKPAVAHRSLLARRASDHLPVYTTLAWDAGGGGA